MLLMHVVGKSLTWLGYANTSNFDDSIRGTYSIDGEPPIEFTYRKPTTNLVNGPQSIDNQVFFQTKQYASGKHHLQVVNKGSTTPLSLLNLLIQNSTFDFTPSPVPPIQSLASTTASISSSSSSSSSDRGNRQERGRPLGAIIGGCVGALGVILCLVCLLLFQRARRRSRAQNELAGAHQYTYGLSGAHDDEKGRQEPTSSPIPDPSHISHPTSPQSITLPDSVVDQSQPRETIMVHQDSGIRYPHTFDQPENTETDHPPQYTSTLKMP